MNDMTATEALDAYLNASSRAWRAFLDYRAGVAGDRAVRRANEIEADALSALRLKLAELDSGADGGMTS